MAGEGLRLSLPRIGTSMAERLVIAVDCDDVLIPSRAFLVNEYNRRYGASVRLGQEFEEWGDEYNEVMRRCGEIAQSSQFKNLRPDTEAMEALCQLAQSHELHLVTARKEDERDFTQTALDAAAPGVFKSMNFLGWTASKGDTCRELGADMLIDDSAHHLRGALQAGISGGAILFGDYPWNRDDRADEALVFCPDWNSVKEAIDAIAKA